MVKLKNTLCQYQGGGYSGCYWEWNFFYLDKNGKFHDIFSSGKRGITTFEDAIRLLENDDIPYIYDLDSFIAFEDFANETNVALVKLVIGWFIENTDIKLYALCSLCNNKIFNSEEMILDDDEMLCVECYSINTCSYCGEYFAPDDADDNGLMCSKEDIRKIWDVPDKIAQDVIDNYGLLCTYCCEKLLNREIGEQIEQRRIKHDI